MIERLFFLHIPKTAGRYVWSLIRENFDENSVGLWAPHDWQGIFNESQESLNAKDAISGHLIHQIDDLFSDGRPLFKFTMLRDPVERVISHYLYIRYGSPSPILDFLENPYARMMFDNVQTRLIGTNYSIDDIRKIISKDRSIIDPSVGEVLQESMLTEDAASLLDNAVARLRQTDLFGIKEMLSDTGHRLADRTGLVLPIEEMGEAYHYRHSKMASETAIDHISAMNKTDIELYRIAKDMFTNE